MKAYLEHKRKIAEIRAILLNWKGQEGSVQEHISNTMREKTYKKRIPPLNLSRLNRVLSIDPERRVAYVEPGVTMEKLVEASLLYHLIPPVVPEFRSITVGGAINGAALESSSHLFGQFNDICLSYEILLGDGELIKASKDEHADLFYAVASSYGTLGYLVGIELAVVPTSGYVELSYSTFDHVQDVLKIMNELHKKQNPPDMIEAIVYNETKSVLISAKNLLHSAGPVTRTFSHYFDQWFYSHADSHLPKKEILSLQDYLFRHDRGAFWMAGYALHPTLLLRYWFHKLCLIMGIDKEANWFMPPYAFPKNPGSIFRRLFGWIVSSQRLYQSLHGGSEKWFEKRFVIQDFYLPLSKTAELVNYVLKRYGIKPIWLCPIKNTETAQIFSPHFSKKEELLVDIGIYGLPNRSSGPEAVKDLENLTFKLGGRKMFYCHSYLSEQDFWKIYPEGEYRRLRKKARMDERLPDITEKVLS